MLLTLILVLFFFKRRGWSRLPLTLMHAQLHQNERHISAIKVFWPVLSPLGLIFEISFPKLSNKAFSLLSCVFQKSHRVRHLSHTRCNFPASVLTVSNVSTT